MLLTALPCVPVAPDTAMTRLDDMIIGSQIRAQSDVGLVSLDWSNFRTLVDTAALLYPLYVPSVCDHDEHLCSLSNAPA